ncbi:MULTISPECIES: hypothetical protein [Methylococcus]|uniref:Uncharacterized protein n=1 Tax=Methylococcus capsulatus TaxID=414 RepID=A0ABZ2F5Z0_METCP|nr:MULTISPECIES: hypothetical protein [Methylococcus]MDF9391114.1 hypothetical protein [Methylococcus capsulatus]
MAAVLVIRFFAPVYTREADLLRAAMLYASAVLTEYFDPALFAIGGMVSGRTLKHLLAAFAIYQLVPMLRARRPISGTSPCIPGTPRSRGCPRLSPMAGNRAQQLPLCAIAMIVGL